MNDHETFSDRNDRETFSNRREAFPDDEARSTARGAVYLLIGILAVLTIACGYLFWHVHQMETATSAWNATTSQELASLRQTVAANDSTHFKNMESLQADLEEARHQAAMTAGCGNFSRTWTPGGNVRGLSNSRVPMSTSGGGLVRRV